MAEDKCCKVEPKEHISAVLESRELMREFPAITCDNNLLECITSNYLIVKRILGHLQWQDQLICKFVCKMWCDAVRTLQNEVLSPEDFVFEIYLGMDSAILKKSGSFFTEPLAIMTFTNMTGFAKMNNCSFMEPNPCKPACGEVHWLIDCVDQELCYPKECNLIVRACSLSYLPLATSVTRTQSISARMLAASSPFLCGLYIPKIPNVTYEVLNIKANCDMQKDFYDVISKRSESQVFKGIIVFVTDKYLLNSLDDIVFLNHFKQVQPDIPYAFGGCIIEDTVFERSDLCFFINKVNSEINEAEFISENVVSIAMFSIPKNYVPTAYSSNFEMYSVVIEFSDWSKPKIQKAVKEFADSIPKFEHSVVFKLSCVGRDERHEFEQDTFRASFPNTPLIGCYGNGELGHNHPKKVDPKPPLSKAKRHKKDHKQFDIMYSYSTVFVYVGWGKEISKPAK